MCTMYDSQELLIKLSSILYTLLHSARTRSRASAPSRPPAAPSHTSARMSAPSLSQCPAAHRRAPSHPQPPPEEQQMPSGPSPCPLARTTTTGRMRLARAAVDESRARLPRRTVAPCGSSISAQHRGRKMCIACCQHPRIWPKWAKSVPA